jgi:hypothetical protein
MHLIAARASDLAAFHQLAAGGDEGTRLQSSKLAVVGRGPLAAATSYVRFWPICDADCPLCSGHSPCASSYPVSRISDRIAVLTSLAPSRSGASS